MKATRILWLGLFGIPVFCLCGNSGFAQQATTESSTVRSAKGINGHWEGRISHRGISQDIRLDISEQNSKLSANIDIPAMGMLNVPLEDFALQGNAIVFALPLGRGRILAQQRGDRVSGATSDDEYDEFRVFIDLKRAVKESPPYKRENVTFYNRDIKLAGTLVSPLYSSPHSAIVILHGSNPRTRDFFVYSFLGDFFARNGIAVLLYDGRGAGESSGDFPTATFKDLAEDALAGVRFLQTRSEIRSNKIGLWGISQGGWVAPEAASMSKEVAFLIIVSGAAVSPMEQMNFSTANALRENNFSDKSIGQAIALRNKVNLYYQSKVSREVAQTEVDKNRTEEWFPFASLPGGGDLPTDFSRSKWSREFSYDPQPALEKIKIPVLVLWGDSDPIMPIKLSLPIWKRAFQKARNKNVTYKGFVGADHILSVSSAAGEQWNWRRIAPSYYSTMLDWVSKNTK